MTTKPTYKFDDYSTPLTLEEVRVVARDTAAEYIKMLAHTPVESRRAFGRFMALNDRMLGLLVQICNVGDDNDVLMTELILQRAEEVADEIEAEREPTAPRPRPNLRLVK